MTLGENIRERRKELGWGQRELAKRVGYKDNSTIAKIESGKIDIPLSKVELFANVLRTTPAYLMGWEEEEKKNDTISDAVVRMRTDDDFMCIVETLLALDSEKLSAAKIVLNALK